MSKRTHYPDYFGRLNGRHASGGSSRTFAMWQRPWHRRASRLPHQDLKPQRIYLVFSCVKGKCTCAHPFALRFACLRMRLLRTPLTHRHIHDPNITAQNKISLATDNCACQWCRLPSSVTKTQYNHHFVIPQFNRPSRPRITLYAYSISRATNYCNTAGQPPDLNYVHQNDI